MGRNDLIKRDSFNFYFRLKLKFQIWLRSFRETSKTFFFLKKKRSKNQNLDFSKGHNVWYQKNLGVVA